jgi:predicted RNA-binding Zn-ribbon protein involved in translation (DUF1610 family)
MKNNIFTNRWMVDDFGDSFEKTNLIRRKKDLEYRSQSDDRNGRVIYDRHNFKCVNCGIFVTAGRELSGVNNRNHCPICLWSRHMDLLTPGDRRSDCLSRMQPVGLTMKHTLKRYGQDNPGELMLIHICTGCGKVSINRIAADDDAQAVFHVYMNSCESGAAFRNSLISEGISLLSTRDNDMVQTQLFGRNEFMESSIINQ